MRAAVRSHFACPSAAGAPLYTLGGPAYAQSHWRGDVFGPELMIPDRGNVLSNITLALAHDSGWYAPDFQAAEAYAYGSSAGCGFLDGTGKQVRGHGRCSACMCSVH